jgi:hypothetical protein
VPDGVRQEAGERNVKKATMPMQPIYKDHNGTARFCGNALVVYLLDYVLEQDGIDLNYLAKVPASDEDRRQFAQLIGFTVYTYGNLPYARQHWTAAAADEAAEKIDD